MQRRPHGILQGVLSLALLVGVGAEAARPLSRREFTARLGTIRITHADEGIKTLDTRATSESQVRRLLGEPDDVVLFEEDSLRGGTYAASLQHGERRLCYGTEGHRTLPTLGWIIIDAQRKVRRLAGGVGKPPADGLFTEAVLRRTLRLIHEAPDQPLYSEDWDPQRLIQVANGLQPLGAARARAAIKEYARVTALGIGYNQWADRSRCSLYALLHVLFGRRHPDDRFFGIQLQDDVPFLTPPVSGFLGQNLTFHYEDVDYFRSSGQFRPLPLRPPAAPYGLVDAAASSPDWTRLVGGDPRRDLAGRRALMTQVVRLVGGPSVTEDARALRKSVNREALDQVWEGIVRQRTEERLRWDAGTNRYVRTDSDVAPTR